VIEFAKIVSVAKFYSPYISFHRKKEIMVGNREKFRETTEADERYRKERWRPMEVRRSSKDATTFYFSNFPATHGEYDMIRVFQKWARGEGGFHLA